MDLSTKELDTAKEIIENGLSKAAKSMEFFTKSPTSLNLEDELLIVEGINLDRFSEDDTFFLLTTNIEGELGGVSYLIITSDVADELIKVAYPNKTFEEEKLQKKKSRLLLEMDNIVSASVLTEFANKFEYRTYGGVPHIDTVNGKELKTLLKSNKNNEAHVIDFKAEMVANDVEISTEFFWFVGNKFIEGIKKIAI